MSAVVLRCDNCGTSQSGLGLCEACHEGQVRYFCKNHDPGRWLDGPKCTQCGAAYGVAAGPPPTRPKAGTVRTGGTRKRPVSDVPAPAAPPPKKRGPWGSRPAPSEEIRCKRRTDSAGTGGRKITPDAGWSRLQPPSAGFQRLYVWSFCAEDSRRLFQSHLAVRVFLPLAFIAWLKFRNDDARLLECSLAAPALPWRRRPKLEPATMVPGILPSLHNAKVTIRPTISQ